MHLETQQKEKTTLDFDKRERRNGRQVDGYITREPIGLSHREFSDKRILDLCIVFLASPILIPLAIVTAVLIKLDSNGSIFFTQERVGHKGKTFTMYKFRSMVVNSEQNGSKFAKEDDHRVTKLGKLIRKYRIDEIPQFWNVLIGDMSIVGPRPEQVSFVECFNNEIPKYKFRHFVKPGITGLAQVHQGYAACKRSTKMKLRYDLLYIENQSFWLDLEIIIKTLKIIVTGFGSR